MPPPAKLKGTRELGLLGAGPGRLGTLPWHLYFAAYFFSVSLSFPEKERAPGSVQPPRALQVPQGGPCNHCRGRGWENCQCVSQPYPMGQYVPPGCPYCRGGREILLLVPWHGDTAR